MQPTFFPTASKLRAWLEKHHSEAGELWVGFYKKGSGRPSITWPESVDAALCFGWIDGVRKSIDGESYAIRFTPRRPGSAWSAKNVTRAQELRRLGLMHPAGMRAFEEGAKSAPRRYSYEQDQDVTLDPAYQRQIRADGRAWKFFQDQTPSYRKAAIWWIMSAKKEETKLKRLATLIQDSENGRTIRSLTRPKR